MLICYLKIHGGFNTIDIKEMYEINAKWHECERPTEREGAVRNERANKVSKQAKNKQNQNQRRQTQKNHNLWTNHSVHVAVWRHIEPLNYSAASLRLSLCFFCSWIFVSIACYCLVCQYLWIYNKRCAGRVRVAHTLIKIRYTHVNNFCQLKTSYAFFLNTYIFVVCEGTTRGEIKSKVKKVKEKQKEEKETKSFAWFHIFLLQFFFCVEFVLICCAAFCVLSLSLAVDFFSSFFVVLLPPFAWIQVEIFFNGFDCLVWLIFHKSDIAVTKDVYRMSAIYKWGICGYFYSRCCGWLLRMECFSPCLLRGSVCVLCSVLAYFYSDGCG